MAFAERKRRSWAREGKEPREDCEGRPGPAGRELESRAQRGGRKRGVARLPGGVGNRTGCHGEPDPGLERVSEGEEGTPARAQRRNSGPRTGLRAPGTRPRCRERPGCGGEEETKLAVPHPPAR